MKTDLAMANWLPRRFLKQDEHQLNCEWLYLGNKRFEEPFFDETILLCLSNPYNSKQHKVVTNIADMVKWAPELPAVEPSAFIFHTSRCGSTLMTQFLSLFPQNIVVPEYAALDQLLRLPMQGFFDQLNQQEIWVKACIRFLGQRRFPEEEKLIIKLDCWHFIFFEKIATWYPEVPKIILCREPGASIRSHLKQPGMQAVPGLLEPELFGLDRSQVAQVSQWEYLNLLFGAMYTQIQSILSIHPDVLLLDYGDGVENMLDQLLKHLALKPNIEIQQRLFNRLRYHSKQSREVFAEQAATDVSSTVACINAYEQLRYKKRKDGRN